MLIPQWIEWMPSPPLVPDDDLLDRAHLSRMTLGDADLEREVLAMFADQSVALLSRLTAFPADAAALAHTLNGSARAIGAASVASAAAAVEHAGGDPRAAALALRDLQEAVATVRLSIDSILARL